MLVLFLILFSVLFSDTEMQLELSFHRKREWHKYLYIKLALNTVFNYLLTQKINMHFVCGSRTPIYIFHICQENDQKDNL